MDYRYNISFMSFSYFLIFLDISGVVLETSHFFVIYKTQPNNYSVHTKYLFCLPTRQSATSGISMFHSSNKKCRK